MPGGFKKLLDDISGMTYEKIDNNPDDYRFSLEEPEDIRKKIKYLNMHIKKAEEINQHKEIIG